MPASIMFWVLAALPNPGRPKSASTSTTFVGMHHGANTEHLFCKRLGRKLSCSSSINCPAGRTWPPRTATRVLGDSSYGFWGIAARGQLGSDVRGRRIRDAGGRRDGLGRVGRGVEYGRGLLPGNGVLAYVRLVALGVINVDECRGGSVRGMDE